MRLLPRVIGPLFAIAALGIAGCSRNTPSAPATPVSTSQIHSATSDGFPRSLVDATGKTRIIDAPPRRIVSLAPATTEVLFDLGAGASVVADTDSEDFPPEAKNRPHISGLSTSDMEKILAQNPDLVVADASINARLISALEQAKVPALVVRAKTVEEVYETIRLLGKAVGQDTRANQIVAGMQSRIDTVRNTTAKARSRPRILIMYGVRPIYTTGPGSFITDLIGVAGGDSIVTHPLPGNIIGEEKVLELQPDVILCSHGLQEQVKQLPGWAQGVPAVRNSRFFSASSDALLTRPSPRLAQGVEELARYLHPELFPATTSVKP